MKVIYSYNLSQINLLLVRGNLFQDKNVQAYVVTNKLLKKYARYFKLSYIEYKFPGLQANFLVFSRHFSFISRENLGNWLLENNNWSNLMKASIKPVWIDSQLIIPWDWWPPLKPSFISLGEKSIILISRSNQRSGPRDVVEKTFLELLEIAEKQNLSSIGCIPFANKWAEIDAINGIVDAIKIFKSTYLKEVRIFEMNKKNDQRIFSAIDNEIKAGLQQIYK